MEVSDATAVGIRAVTSPLAPQDELIEPVQPTPAPPAAVAVSAEAPVISVVASAAQSVSPRALSIAQRCDQDSLSGVFSFSESLSDVVAAAQTCRSWRATASLRQSSCRSKV
jgi:hypothetical protein